MSTANKEIIAELSAEFNLPPHIIERIVKSQFKFVSKVMRDKSYAPVRLHHLGVFAIKPKRLEYLKENGWIKDTNS